jgi:predicted MPP superfamily phosphohydrolase
LKKKNKIWIISTTIIIVILTMMFLYWQNNHITETNLTYNNSEIPQSFNDFKIVQISDLHNKSFGKKQSRLSHKLQKINPNIIVITGDLIDKDKTDIEVAMDFVVQAVEISPVYYVSGNHEKISGKYNLLKSKLIQAGAIVLDNDIATVKINGESIHLVGLMDVGFYAYGYTTESVLRSNLTSLLDSANSFSIVLSHRPEFINDYVKCNAKLVLTGHAHGGQIRLPFIGGLVAPGQGFFPKYTNGSHTIDGTTMIVSRGLGNSIFPFRVFNRPEIVVVKLVSE